MYDIIIENGQIVDGSGELAFRADLGIRDEKIVSIGGLAEQEAKERIDATGLVVAPGFIDIHCHSDSVLFKTPREQSKILQGVTTETIGNCGLSAAPVEPRTFDLLQKYTASIFADGVLPWSWRTTGEFLDCVQKHQTISNVAALVGHGTVRIAAMGFDDRTPNAAEMEQMKQLVADALAEGAFGLSSGLIYPPGVFSQTPEMVELCRVVAAAGGLYATHMRNEGDLLVESVQETIRVGLESGVSVEISHHKAAGPKNWGKVKQTLQLMAEASQKGLDINCDVYPYTASSTVLGAVLPPWVQAGGSDCLLQRLRDPASRERIKAEFKTGLPGWDQFIEDDNWECIVIASCAKNHESEGKSLAVLAAMRGQDPADTLFDLMLEEQGEILMLAFRMCEEDVATILRHPLSMVGSDAIPSPGKPHPRFFGTFPRVLRKYVREENLLTLPEAVRKMSSLPARKLGLQDRGLIRTGMAADIVVFDAATVADRSEYNDPCQYATGVDTVLVNGRVAVRGGKYTGALDGKVLRK